MYINTHINRFSFKTKIVNNEKDIKLGMMGKKFTKDFDALLFIMNTPTSSFWMKNCIISLDIIFIKNNVITKVHHNCPPCNSTNNACKKYKGNGTFEYKCSHVNIKNEYCKNKVYLNGLCKYHINYKKC